MRNEEIIKEALKFKDLVSKKLNESNDKREKFEVQGALKVLDSMLYRLGYKAPKKNNNLPSLDIYKAKAEEPKQLDTYNNNPPANPFKTNEVKAEEPKEKKNFPASPFVVTKEQHEKNEKQKPKKVRTNPDDKQAIALAVKDGKSIAEMSEELRIEESAIRKVLGLKDNTPKNILATNKTKNNG